MYGYMIVWIYVLCSKLVFYWKSFFSLLDGGLYIITPVDPLFLILPYLTKFSQKVPKLPFDCTYMYVYMYIWLVLVQYFMVCFKALNN